MRRYEILIHSSESFVPELQLTNETKVSANLLGFFSGFLESLDEMNDW
jgi:hypothetical protein